MLLLREKWKGRFRLLKYRVRKDRTEYDDQDAGGGKDRGIGTRQGVTRKVEEEEEDETGGGDVREKKTPNERREEGMHQIGDGVEEQYTEYSE